MIPRRVRNAGGVAVGAFIGFSLLHPIIQFFASWTLIGSIVAWFYFRSGVDVRAARMRDRARMIGYVSAAALLASLLLDRLPLTGVLVVAAAAAVVAARWVYLQGDDWVTSSDLPTTPAGRLHKVAAWIEELERAHARDGVAGAGAGAGGNTLRVIRGVCGDAAAALTTGLDPSGIPIDVAQVADGLRRLAADARRDTGVVATSLDPGGVALYGAALDEIARIAEELVRP